MARCVRHFLNTINYGVPSVCAQKTPKGFTNISFSFSEKISSRFKSTLSSPLGMTSLLRTQCDTLISQKPAFLHMLCRQTFSAGLPLQRLTCDNYNLQKNCDYESLLKTDSKYLVPMRTGTGSRGSMPHPTANIPIAVIGPNCQLDTHQAGWANELLITLDPEMRHQLFDALREYESMVWSPGTEAEFEAMRARKDDENKRLTSKELRQLAFFSGIPFVGFGTLDNLIMISAGEYIDTTFGAMLGISTMAAAAIGNMVSDVVGLGTAGYVENVARKMGVQPPKMSPTQLDMTSTKLTSNLGRVIGVLIGCTIGMLPLLICRRDEDKDEDEDGDKGNDGADQSATGAEAAASQTDEKTKKGAAKS